MSTNAALPSAVHHRLVGSSTKWCWKVRGTYGLIRSASGPCTVAAGLPNSAGSMSLSGVISMPATRRKGRHITTGNTFHGSKPNAFFHDASGNLVIDELQLERLSSHRITKSGRERRTPAVSRGSLGYRKSPKQRGGAIPRVRSRMQDQFLNSPIEELRHIKHVLGRTRDLVNPAELLELLARFAEHAKDLALERELVDATRVRI